MKRFINILLVLFIVINSAFTANIFAEEEQEIIVEDDEQIIVSEEPSTLETTEVVELKDKTTKEECEEEEEKDLEFIESTSGELLSATGGFDPDDKYNGWCGDDVAYHINLDNTMVIYGVGDMYDFDEACLPQSERITEVVIEEGVTSVGKNAFSNFTSLQYIELADTIEYIDNSAFENCLELNHINIPANIEMIGERAFYNCKNLEEVVITNSDVDVKTNAFAGCENLRKVYLPSSTAINAGNNVEAQVFYNCSKALTIYTDALTKADLWYNYWNNISDEKEAYVEYNISLEDYLDNYALKVIKDVPYDLNIYQDSDGNLLIHTANKEYLKNIKKQSIELFKGVSTTGDVTADASGNVTGNATGNATWDSTGDATGNALCYSFKYSIK